MHNLLHSQPQSLLHVLRHRLPANQSLCCHLRSLLHYFHLRQILHFLPGCLRVFALIGLRRIQCYSGLLRFQELQILLRTFGVAGMNFCANRGEVLHKLFKK